MTSTGVPRTPDGNAERPSLVARAPVSPEEKKTYVKGAPRSSFPATWMPQMLAEPSAMTRAGSAWPRAHAMTCGRKWPMTCRPATAAGRLTLRIEPSGAVMRNDLHAVGRVGFGVVHHHVHAAPARGRGAGVVDPELVAPHLAARADRDRLVEAVGGDRVLVGAGLQRLDRPSHRTFRTPDNLVGRRLEPLEPELVHELQEPLATDGAARDLGVEELHDRDLEPLLVDLAVHLARPRRRARGRRRPRCRRGLLKLSSAASPSESLSPVVRSADVLCHRLTQAWRPALVPR